MSDQQADQQPNAISPTAAAAAVNVSRWRIMKAIKSQELKAVRDNHNNWQIWSHDLADWQRRHCSDSVGQQPNDRQNDSTNSTDTSHLQRQLAAETARANAAEADRDRWHRMAEQLASKPRFKWPWQR